MHLETKPRICFVVASPATISAFLVAHIEALSEFFDIDVIANLNGNRVESLTNSAQIDVPILRRISLLDDLRALRILHHRFKKEKYIFVHSVTPKAGLLAMSAARMAHVPIRIHWFTGQVWVTRKGLTRWFLRLLDRITATFATDILVDSPSQLEFLVNQDVVKPAKASVLGNGSICGVDTDRFRPDYRVRGQVRSELGVAPECLVLLYVGRINRDKGLMDLASVLKDFVTEQNILLLVAGEDEENLVPLLTQLLENTPINFQYLGVTRHPENLMRAADIYCMPSYREGFGLSVIEAAACGIPTIASNIYGLTDAIVDGETGLLYENTREGALNLALSQLINDPLKRVQFGEAARHRAQRQFSTARLVKSLSNFYLDRLK